MKTAIGHTHSRGRYVSWHASGKIGPECFECKEANSLYSAQRGANTKVGTSVAKAYREDDVRALLEEDRSEAIDFAVAKVVLGDTQVAWKPGGRRIYGRMPQRMRDELDGIVIYGPCRVTYVETNGRISWSVGK